MLAGHFKGRGLLTIKVLAKVTQNSLSDSEAADSDDGFIHYDNSDRKLPMTLGLFTKKNFAGKGRPHKLLA